MKRRMIVLGIALPLAAGELYPHLEAIARRQLAERRAAMARLTAPEQVRARAAEVRARLLRYIGGLPAARGPLNLRRTGALDRDNYRVEKIAFESQPRFWVTANLYIPKSGKPPYPAVIQPPGHSLTAKSRELYQSLSIGLARYGFVVLTYDPLGQGERRVFWTPQLRDSLLGASTTAEHSMVGIRALLNGQSLARMMIWDAMRGLDLLESLPEVDRGRLGIAGCSGGGTLTAYVAALDPRLKAAAPACYISSWEDQLGGAGPQDAEQQFPGMLADGLDHGDLVLAFAPKPYLICSTTEDFFPLAGARKTFEEAQRVWNLFGAEDKIAHFVGPGGHGMRADTRGAIDAWMRRWLSGESAAQPVEPAHQIELEEDLQVTETGQVHSSLGSITASELLRRELTPAPAPPKTDRETILRVTRASGEAPGYSHRVLNAAGGRPVVYFSSRPSPDAEAIAALGRKVIVIDEPALNDKTIWLALMTGNTLTGLRMRAIQRALDEAGAPGAIGVAKGGAAVAMLHAAVLDPRLTGLYLEELPVSYRAIAEADLHRGMFDAVLPGVLREYDLPDLVRAIAPRPVRLLNAVNPLGQVLAAPEVRAVYRANAEVLRRRELEPIANWLR